jgi:hypothetical protein
VFNFKISARPKKPVAVWLAGGGVFKIATAAQPEAFQK